MSLFVSGLRLYSTSCVWRMGPVPVPTTLAEKGLRQTSDVSHGDPA